MSGIHETLMILLYVSQNVTEMVWLATCDERACVRVIVHQSYKLYTFFGRMAYELSSHAHPSQSCIWAACTASNSNTSRPANHSATSQLLRARIRIVLITSQSLHISVVTSLRTLLGPFIAASPSICPIHGTISSEVDSQVRAEQTILTL